MSEKTSFKDLVDKYGVDSEILNKQCTLNDDKFREYCDPRELVGQHLGLTQQEVDNIDRDHDTEEEKQLETMQKWKRKFTYNATYRKLIEALLACNRADNADELCKLLSERDHIAEDFKEMYRNLCDTYSKTPNRDARWQGKFPPLLTSKKFNLALLEIGHIRTGNINDYVKMTITGKVDDIRRQKRPIELKDLFSGIEEGQRKVVVLEGAPGSGKSTICLSICQQWGKKELFQEFKVVILIQLRNPKVQRAKSVEELIQVLADPENAQQLADRLLSTCCQDVLFILDGWDELPLACRTNQHILHRLIEPTPKDNLEKSAVIVTSRPIATYSIPVFSKPKVRQVEVVGFFRKELEQFFTKCLDDTSAARDLMKRIDSTPSLAGSCHLPLNANIIAHLYKDQKHTLPPTQFGIFSKLVCDYIARCKSTEVDEVDSLDDLPQKVRESLNAICELAYEKMMNNEATFELPDPKFETLDLVHGIETFKNTETTNLDPEVFWCFVHLTVQEFLAARYIAKSLSEEEQVALFSKHIEEPRFSQMFQFYAAITQLRHPEFGEIISRQVKQYGSPNATIEQKHLLLSLLHCMYETNNEKLCQSLAKDLPHGLTLSNITLRPSDCVCIGYILSCIVKTQGESEFIVNLVNCKINDLSCQMLVSNLLATSGASTMLKLNIGCNDISPEGIRSICHLLQHNSVRTLDLGDNHSLSNTGIEHIFDQLKTNTSLKQLHLFGCELTNNGLVFIADALPHNKTLEELDLSYNDLRISTSEDKGLEKLANALKTDNCHLKVLHLSNCCLSDSEIDQVIPFLQNNTTMEALLLNNYQYRQSVVNPNVISTGKVSDLTECLTHNGTLLKLTLPVEITPFIAGLQSTVNKIREERGQKHIEVNVERASIQIL